MAQQLSEDELAAITNTFTALDRNGDGVISREELRAAMAAEGMYLGDEAIDLELQRADLNADGKITLREWLHMWSVTILSRR